MKQDLDKYYDQRKADILSKSPARKEFWKSGNPSSLGRPSASASSLMAQLDREKNEVLGELFKPSGLAAINRPGPLAPRPLAGQEWLRDGFSSRRRPRLS